jgi:exonuclease SbcC
MLSTKKTAKEAALNALKANWDAATLRKTKADNAFAAAEELLKERRRAEQTRLAARDNALSQFAKALSDHGFADLADYAAALVTEDDLATMRDVLAEYAKRGEQLSRDIARLTGETMGKERPDVEKLQEESAAIAAEATALAAKRDEINARLNETQKKLRELHRTAKELEKVEKSYAAVKQLDDTASGKVAYTAGGKLDFETYAQMAYFERVLRAANLRLKSMSQNRYTLLRREDSEDGRKKTGLEIEVLDSYTGKARSANSLSGGESFMASLSLALGLSDVVQQASGGLRLDAMFIDEGFGSLDADTLDLAVRTLSEMAGVGRSVGIISHVAELRERVDKQIRVEKTLSGSRLSMIT